MLESKTIRFLKINDDGWYCAKSGPIKCDKGFKVRFDLRTPFPGKTDWTGTAVYLIDSQVPVDDHEDMLDSGDYKEDPSVHAYGVWPYEPSTLNIKTESNNTTEDNRLPSSSPITMEYDRQAQTVRFTSTHFDFYQTGLPKDVTFVVGVYF